MDLSQRLGKYPAPPQAGPILGVECSGIVTELSAEAADRFMVGDEVFGLTYGGAYAEYVAVQAGTLIHKPASLSWEEAAAIPEVNFITWVTRKSKANTAIQAWMTVTQAMYLVGDFAAGKTILWHAGASSISIAGVQLSVARGAKATYITTSSAEKIDFCEKVLGATKGFNYKEEDFSQAILEATGGRGVDIIVDFVGASHFQQNLDALAKDGTVVALAAMSGVTVSNLDISAFVRKRVSVRGSSLRSRDEAYQAELCKLFVKEVLPLIEAGKLKLMIEKIYPWTEIVEAHKLMESNQTKGKIICSIK
jgi:NADPH2:quinone reductase